MSHTHTETVPNLARRMLLYPLASALIMEWQAGERYSAALDQGDARHIERMRLHWYAAMEIVWTINASRRWPLGANP